MNDYKPIDYYECWWGHGHMPNLNFDFDEANPSENSIKDASLHAYTKMDEKSLNRWRECYPFFRTNKNYAVPKLYYERCFDYFLSQQHLPAYDRISMFFSIELRVPFLQNRIKYRNQINGILDLKWSK